MPEHQPRQEPPDPPPGADAHLAEYWATYSPDPNPDVPFGWTQWTRSTSEPQVAEHGPGAELLDGYHRLADLGCAFGRDAAYLARRGHQVTGIDLSPVQIERARSLYGDVPGLHFVAAAAQSHLAAHTEPDTRYDAVYSMWGAVMHTDPHELLPLIRSALRPAGKLMFSQVPPLPGCSGKQGHYAGGFKGPDRGVYRWLYSPASWTRILTRHGFTATRARIIPAPHPGDVGTVLVETHTPGTPT